MVIVCHTLWRRGINRFCHTVEAAGRVWDVPHVAVAGKFGRGGATRLRQCRMMKVCHTVVVVGMVECVSHY